MFTFSGYQIFKTYTQQNKSLKTVISPRGPSCFQFHVVLQALLSVLSSTLSEYPPDTSVHNLPEKERDGHRPCFWSWSLHYKAHFPLGPSRRLSHLECRLTVWSWQLVFPTESNPLAGMRGAGLKLGQDSHHGWDSVCLGTPDFK